MQARNAFDVFESSLRSWLRTIGQLIVMFGQKPWQISETLECSFKTDISQQKYSIKKVNRGKKDEKTYFTRQKPHQTFCVVQKEIRKEVMIYGTKSAIHNKQRGHSSS